MHRVLVCLAAECVAMYRAKSMLENVECWSRHHPPVERCREVSPHGEINLFFTLTSVDF